MLGLVPMFWTDCKPSWPAERGDHHSVTTAGVLSRGLLQELPLSY